MGLNTDVSAVPAKLRAVPATVRIVEKNYSAFGQSGMSMPKTRFPGSAINHNEIKSAGDGLCGLDIVAKVTGAKPQPAGSKRMGKCAPGCFPQNELDGSGDESPNTGRPVWV